MMENLGLVSEFHRHFLSSMNKGKKQFGFDVKLMPLSTPLLEYRKSIQRKPVKICVDMFSMLQHFFKLTEEVYNHIENVQNIEIFNPVNIRIFVNILQNLLKITECKTVCFMFLHSRPTNNEQNQILVSFIKIFDQVVDIITFNQTIQVNKMYCCFGEQQKYEKNCGQYLKLHINDGFLAFSWNQNLQMTNNLIMFLDIFQIINLIVCDKDITTTKKNNFHYVNPSNFMQCSQEANFLLIIQAESPQVIKNQRTEFFGSGRVAESQQIQWQGSQNRFQARYPKHQQQNEKQKIQNFANKSKVFCIFEEETTAPKSPQYSKSNIDHISNISRRLFSNNSPQRNFTQQKPTFEFKFQYNRRNKRFGDKSDSDSDIDQ